MILIIDTERLPGRSIHIAPLVIPLDDGCVNLNGYFRKASIAEALQYQVEKAVQDASDYHYETYHADDLT